MPVQGVFLSAPRASIGKALGSDLRSRYFFPAMYLNIAAILKVAAIPEFTLLCYNTRMGKSFAKISRLTPQKKATAKANSLKSMLTSFKIEGIVFSRKQIEAIKSRAHLSK